MSVIHNRPALFTPRKVFEKAIELVTASGTANMAQFQDAYAVEDVLEIIAVAKAKYEVQRKGSKVRERLAAVSSRVTYYGQILDVLSQHHPEYVSLAWGTMKFLFVLVLNHEETTSELAKALTYIGDALPRVKIQLDIFNTEWIRKAVEQLYADILTFLDRSLQWYEQSSFKRAWKSFVAPYKLHFKDIRDKIDEGARRIDNMANTLAQEKINKIHDLLVHFQQSVSANHLVYLARFSGLDRGQNQIQTDLIVKTTGDTTLSSPMETLQFCQSIRRNRLRRPGYNKEVLFPKLGHWSSALHSSLVVIGGSGPTRFQAKDLATEMVDLLQLANKSVLWVLKGPRNETPVDSVHTLLLKQLVYQAVQLNNGRVIGHISENFNAPRVSSARTEDDWLGILRDSLTGMSEVYLVIDMEALEYRPGDEAASWLAFFSSIQSFVNSVPGVVVKAAVISYRQDFIRSIDSTSFGPLVVPLGKQSRQTSSKVKKRQPWRKKKDVLLRVDRN